MVLIGSAAQVAWLVGKARIRAHAEMGPRVYNHLSDSTIPFKSHSLQAACAPYESAGSLKTCDAMLISSQKYNKSLLSYH
jgi:hypothetical protein